MQFSSLRTLETHFQIEFPADEIRASYNIAPTQEVLALVHSNGRRVDKYHWGLVPFWSKDLTLASRLINARAETVAAKPSFRTAFKRRRCLILADGYYEWKGQKGHKQPYFIFLPDRQPFAFAGLWERWKPQTAAGDHEDQIEYKSCTIITRMASKSVRDIHHRMPVILKPEAYDDWLDPKIQQADYLENILEIRHFRQMKNYAVSKFVNRVQNNTAECIDPLPGVPA